MKIRKSCFAVFCLLLIFLTGCGKEPRIPTIGEPMGIEQVNRNPGLVLSCAVEAFPQDVEELVFVLENNTDEEYYYGVNHNVIEYEVDGVWHLLVAAPSEKEFPLTEVALVCRPHQKEEVIIPMEYYGTEFPVGRYRFILDCGRRKDEADSTYWYSEDFLSCTFEIK